MNVQTFQKLDRFLRIIFITPAKANQTKIGGQIKLQQNDKFQLD